MHIYIYIYMYHDDDHHCHQKVRLVTLCLLCLPCRWAAANHCCRLDRRPSKVSPEKRDAATLVALKSTGCQE